MPTIVIHALNQPPQKFDWEGKEIKVGRDPATNHLVLPGKTISRENAVFRSEPDGRWHVTCVSETNPVVVDGALTSATAFVGEGSEILLGTEYLLIFSRDAFTAATYMGDKSHFSRSVCGGCRWSGMVSTLRRKPTCPRCGSADLRSESQYRRDAAAQLVSMDTTTTVDPAEVRSKLATLRTARRSRIERVDGREGGKKELSEDHDVVIGKTPEAHFKLAGVNWGGGVVIRWNGRGYEARSTVSFPGMRVNGVKVDAAQLANGDVIEVGSNRFRFVTE
jgi:hypothetical protein